MLNHNFYFIFSKFVLDSVNPIIFFFSLPFMKKAKGEKGDCEEWGLQEVIEIPAFQGAFTLWIVILGSK